MEKKYKTILFIMVVFLVIFASISTYLIYEKYYINNKENQSENNYNIFEKKCIFLSFNII